MSPSPAASDPARAARGFWVVTLVFCVGMAFSTVPTPLYPLYEARRGYGVATITVIFAVYPVAVMASLFVLGHLSDWTGRRRALVAALALEALSALVFVAGTALPLLLLARVACGVGVGILTATASAYLGELDSVRGNSRSHVVVVAASLGGFGAGALLSGALASLAPAPLRLPYVVFGLGLVLGAFAAARLPETLPARPARRRTRVQHISVPPHDRGAFFVACALGFAAMSLLSMFTALAPTLLARTVPSSTPALAGATACTCCLAAALGQVVLSRLGRGRLLGAGPALLPAGVALLGVAVWRGSFPLFLLAGAVGGLGSGTLLNRAVATVERVAPPESRAETFAGFYLATYFNGTVPVVGLGVVTQALGPLAAVSVYAAMVLVVLGYAVLAPVRAGAALAAGSLNR